MTGTFVAYLVAGALAGGFVNGMAGTGTALFALGFYLVVLDPPQAVAVVALMSVLVGLQGLWIVRSAIRAQPRRVLRFVIPGLLGVPVGLTLLNTIDATTLRIAVGTLLIVYGAYFGFRSALPAFERPTPWIDGTVGFIGGVMGGAAAVSGALPQIWLSIRPWTKSETRAVMQSFNASVLWTTIIALAFDGTYNQTALTALAITVPCGLIAAQAGIATFHRLSDTGFRRLLILLTLAMGIGVLASEVF